MYDVLYILQSSDIYFNNLHKHRALSFLNMAILLTNKKEINNVFLMDNHYFLGGNSVYFIFVTHICFPHGSVSKESVYNAGEPSSIPRWGK